MARLTAGPRAHPLASPQQKTQPKGEGALTDGEIAERFRRMSTTTSECHAHPWSVRTRMAFLPLLTLKHPALNRAQTRCAAL